MVALSGGYTRAEACKHLAANHGMIASFSRALTEGLTRDMSDAEFNAALGQSIKEIYQASTVKIKLAWAALFVPARGGFHLALPARQANDRPARFMSPCLLTTPAEPSAMNDG